VEIDLIVRGICCLRPGVEGVSDNIRVRSIVGRFLEHSRVYYFFAGGEEKLYCASADWMPRNFYKRVETAFPITDGRLADRVLYEGLESCLEDNQRAWALGSDGSYSRVRPGKQKPRASQEQLLEILGNPSPSGRVRRHPKSELEDDAEFLVLREPPSDADRSRASDGVAAESQPTTSGKARKARKARKSTRD
jgi:polyphosphate kinase